MNEPKEMTELRRRIIKLEENVRELRKAFATYQTTNMASSPSNRQLVVDAAANLANRMIR